MTDAFAKALATPQRASTAPHTRAFQADFRATLHPRTSELYSLQAFVLWVRANLPADIQADLTAMPLLQAYRELCRRVGYPPETTEDALADVHGFASW